MWTPALDKDSGPLYLAIADALAADIAAGRLLPGAKLPPQRALAQQIGIDFTTVTRAYQEAGRRGLVDGRVGQGTFVRAPSAAEPSPSVGLIDMSMNLPPIPEDDGIAQQLWAGFAKLHGPDVTRLMLRYQEPGGALRDRQAGVRWLASRMPNVSVSRLLVAPGAQGALTAILASLAGKGEVVLTEPLSYPGLISLAAHLGIRLVPVEMDESGPLPDALVQAIAAFAPRAFYCMPTLHNPTTRSWSAARKEEILAVVRDHGLPIVEDDAYGGLLNTPKTTLAEMGGATVFHVASLSKTLSPALRLAYVVAPSEAAAMRLAGALRGTTAMASPLTASLATDWVESGLAFEFLHALRAEVRSRQEIARSLLAAQAVTTDPEGFHSWISLPESWSRGEFIARLRTMGVSAVSSDAFAVGNAPEAVRLSLGGPITRADLSRSLSVVSSLLSNTPAMSSLVV